MKPRLEVLAGLVLLVSACDQGPPGYTTLFEVALNNRASADVRVCDVLSVSIVYDPPANNVPLVIHSAEADAGELQEETLTAYFRRDQPFEVSAVCQAREANGSYTAIGGVSATGVASRAQIDRGYRIQVRAPLLGQVSPRLSLLEK